MRYHKPRIAWSLAWCIAGVLLASIGVAAEAGEQTSNGAIATFDFVDTPLNDLLKLCAGNDGAQLDTSRVPADILTKPVSITYRGTQNGFLNQLSVQTGLRFTLTTSGKATVLSVYQKTPLFQIVLYWLLGAAGVAAAVLIGRWAGWRYGLRTLLIGMTLVAIGLGLLVYAGTK